MSRDGNDFTELTGGRSNDYQCVCSYYDANQKDTYTGSCPNDWDIGGLDGLGRWINDVVRDSLNGNDDPEDRGGRTWRDDERPQDPEWWRGQ
jgi:hypothetical protein